MKYIAIIAMLLSAVDCMEYATGTHPDYILSSSMLWVWWIGAAAWIVNAIRMWFYTVE